MSPQENKQTRDRDPPALFASLNPRVSLPQMSYIQGNAFAQMKAKERERQRQLGESASPNQEQTPRPSTGSGRRSKGLDYDQELALPMPKPRHLPPTEAELAEVASSQRRSSSTYRARLTKKRSGDLAPESPTDSGKKSKVASLRSKFSLKDLAREFRRENSSPPPAVPTLRKSSSSGISAEGGLRTPRLAQSPPSFEEERLYVPKARGGNTEQPSSAPAGKSSFHESLGTDRASQSSMYSSPPAAMAKGEKKAEKFRHAFIHDEHSDGLTMRQTQTGTRLETLLLDGSSPPAHTGELRNAGHPEVVMPGQRVCSMKAEEGPVTPVKATGGLMPAAEIVYEYSPSIYDDNTAEATNAPKAGPVEQNKPASDKQQRQHPLIVSSDQGRKKKAPRRAPSRHAFVPSGPRPAQTQYGPGQHNAPFAPQLDSHQLDSQMPMDEARFFTGTTSHGGFAPPPPHPGYQNTPTLEQHVTSHANSIHHHLDTALGKLTRNTENNINWSTDQLIRQVESVTDVARMLNARTVNQADIIREAQQSIEYLRCQVSELQHQSFRMENKLVECVQTELAQVRTDLRNLPITTSKAPHNTAAGWSSSQGESQGASQYLAKGTKEYEKRQNSKKKARAATVPKSEGVVKRPEEGKKVAAEHNKQGECVVATSAGSLNETGKRAEQQEQKCAAGDRGDLSERGDNNNLHSHPSDLLPPTTFHTPSFHNAEEPNTAINREIRRAIKNPRQESSGSPEPKTSRPASSTHIPQLSPGDIFDATNMVFGFTRSDKDKKAKKADKMSSKKGSNSSMKQSESEPKDVKASSDEVLSKPQDILENEGKPSIEQAITDEKSEVNDEKSETKSLKADSQADSQADSKADSKAESKDDTKDVKSTPNKKKKGVFSSFKRNRDGNNLSSSSSGIFRTPQRNKDKDTGISANEPLISQPIPIPNLTSRYDLYCPLPGSPEAIANQNSTEGDPVFVHPTLRTPRQKAILAERERLEGLARQQSAENIQLQPSGEPSQDQQHMPFGPNPLLPHHIPGISYGGPIHVGRPPMHPPVTFRPILPGRQQQPAPFTHPNQNPPSFGQAPRAIVSHYYGAHGANNSLLTSSLTGAPNVVMPPRWQPGMSSIDDIYMRRWYQENCGQAPPETGNPYEANQSGQGQGNSSPQGNN
ncbi:uncharacterized protein KD926_003778 [Aspergillus affinis]|uniref:uncharacterized protein n=1 Tax=Aspergillus affinis TaxID=1070780 RepID=UPI0022FF293C|nr:uncharacterized protein KD926_003778 [Aspergillus affinis]KAI9035284.1 hypothetical protein KD926_003778 [Aspergillus affinis]